MYQVVISIVCIIALGISAFGKESNTYIRINANDEKSLQNCEMIINSIGGKVNHISPPNEVICFLPSEKYDIFKSLLNSEVESINLKTDAKSYSETIGYKGWTHFKNNKTKTKIQSNISENYLSQYICKKLIYEINGDMKLNDPGPPAYDRLTNQYLIGKIANV